MQIDEVKRILKRKYNAGRKPFEIDRDELNARIDEYTAGGGTVQQLPPEEIAPRRLMYFTERFLEGNAHKRQGGRID